MASKSPVPPHPRSGPLPKPERREPMFKAGPGMKIIGIAFLILLMGVPVSLIGFVTSDRNHEARNAVHRTADQWGGASQVLHGPWLIVPHDVLHTKKVIDRRSDCKGSWSECREERTEINKERKYLVFAPTVLEGDTRMNSHELKRGIHKVPVYDADTTITGRFAAFDPKPATGKETIEVLWDQAYLSFAVSDQRSFRQRATLAWDDKPIAFEPGVVPPSAARINRAGIHAPVAGLKQGSSHSFSISLKLKGSLSLSLMPRGQDITWKMNANWPHPSFAGRFLPVSREVTADGFSADWSLPNVARAPQVTQSLKKLEDAFGHPPHTTSYKGYISTHQAGTAFSVNLHQPIDNYSLMNRALKYALLFIGLVFLTLFLLEMAAGGKPIHPIQYLFVGLANAVFYLLLLALSENIGFAAAYGVSSTATAVLIGLYTWAVLSTLKHTMMVVAALITIYGLLWVILNLQDFALMVGSIVVFVALAISMYATRKIDWYGKTPSPKVDEELPSPLPA